MVPRGDYQPKKIDDHVVAARLVALKELDQFVRLFLSILLSN